MAHEHAAGAALIHLVIVSHSRAVATGVADLARQMAPPELRISAVGGIEDAGEVLLGTDATQVASALADHTGPAGALILVDLGSAVLAAETALELVPAEIAALCCISNAPLVEGAVVAAVEAGVGRTLHEVNRAAEAACTFRKVSSA